MAGLVLATIKTTRRLNKPHNIFVANLMVTDIILAVISLFQQSVMMVGFITGKGDFIPCNVFHYLLSPAVEMYFTLFLISADKIIAIVYPLRYKQIMTPHVVVYAITASWVLAFAIFIPRLFNNDGYNKVAEYGVCLTIKNSSLLGRIVYQVIPVLMSSVPALVIDIYLAIKTYKVRKQIEKETRLSGFSDHLKNLRQRQITVKRHLKPMITLLVVVLSNICTGLLIPLLYIPVRFLDTPVAYEKFVELVAIANIGYIIILTQPSVYGLYFKQTREPLRALLQNVICACKCDSAVVTPQP